ncbi:hypothetical protein LPJ81_006219 [Coemansia sp. IMI 209127]|nr:hypothetical protein LPJ81_006219 [Coemansia sp. IMI 209127]
MVSAFNSTGRHNRTYYTVTSGVAVYGSSSMSTFAHPTKAASPNIIHPTHRSAGIGGYSTEYRYSGIGGHSAKWRDMGIGKACVAVPASKAASNSRSSTPFSESLCSIPSALK